MALYRVRGSKIRLGDQVFSKETGPFELPDNIAKNLLDEGVIIPLNVPLIPGVAEETIKSLDKKNGDLQAQLKAANSKIVELSTLLDKKEADIALLQAGGKKK